MKAKKTIEVGTKVVWTSPVDGHTETFVVGRLVNTRFGVLANPEGNYLVAYAVGQLAAVK